MTDFHGPPAGDLAESLAALHRTLRALYFRRRPADGLPATSIGVLQILRRRGPQRQSALTSLLLLSPSVMSRQIGQLVTAGLVTRSVDPDDRRASQVTITAAGYALLDRHEQWSSQLLVPLLAQWSGTEASATAAALVRLNTDLTAALLEDLGPAGPSY